MCYSKAVEVFWKEVLSCLAIPKNEHKMLHSRIFCSRNSILIMFFSLEYYLSVGVNSIIKNHPWKCYMFPFFRWVKVLSTVSERLIS